ncbi:adenylyl-sulfate kinase [Burkholderia diffusa]|uniref:adenylyl-sulfate kinase n=1 Tax=Burkholderia diffusa TaxID=488732 RepID=UPI00157A9029|nr:adenylyl-sulfate kinase [Burkholderia diffusa]NTY41622.1 adenylyl-sulfate kinase [Burkholderia diffusa]
MNSNDLYRDGAVSPVIWLTGLSGAGKSTIARSLHASIKAKGGKAIVLDGDELRTGICADLSFTVPDRNENIRRIAHIAKLFRDEQYVTIVAVISPLASHRMLARSIIGPHFFEIFVSTPLEECIRRDPKGLYARASSGALHGFTGVTAAYERPTHPDLTFDTSSVTIESTVAGILSLVGTVPNHVPAGD